MGVLAWAWLLLGEAIIRPHCAYSTSSEEASQLIQKGKWGEALQLLRFLRKAEPQRWSLASDTALAELHLNHRAEAFAVLKQLSGLTGGGVSGALVQKEIQQHQQRVLRSFLLNRTQQDFQSGLSFMLAKKWSLAIEQFRRAQLAEPDNLEVALRLAQAWLAVSAIQPALDLLGVFESWGLEEPDWELWFGYALLLAHRPLEASVRLKKASALLPESELAAVWLSEALLRQGNLAQSLQVLEAHHHAHPCHLAALLRATQLLLGTPASGLKSTLLWQAKRNYQLILSRLPAYQAEALEQGSQRSESPLLFDWLGSSAELAKAAHSGLEQVERRIAELSAGQAG